MVGETAVRRVCVALDRVPSSVVGVAEVLSVGCIYQPSTHENIPDLDGPSDTGADDGDSVEKVAVPYSGDRSCDGVVERCGYSESRYEVVDIGLVRS